MMLLQLAQEDKQQWEAESQKMEMEKLETSHINQ